MDAEIDVEQTKNTIAIVALVISTILTLINLVFSGRIRKLTLYAEEKFKQTGKVNDKAIESIQESNFCLRKIKEIFSRGEIFLSKSLRDDLHRIDNFIKHPAVDNEKLMALIKNIEAFSNRLCDLTAETYFPLAKEVLMK